MGLTEFKNIYMDNAATTKVDQRVLDAMIPYFNKYYGNASSIHSMGYRAKIAIEEAREKIAELINASPEQIFFTSGATESNNWILKSCNSISNIVSLETEHDSVYKSILSHSNLLEDTMNSAIDPDVIDIYGKINLIKAYEFINKIEGSILLSVMMANNEIGTIQPVKELAEIVHMRQDRYLHTDSTQYIGHIPLDVKDINVDYLSASAHKMYGPKGVGMLYVKDPTINDFTSFMHGGHQENGLRAGTYNVPGIVGFGEAARIAKKEMSERYSTEVYLGNYFWNRLSSAFSSKCQLNGDPEDRLPNNINVSFKNIDGEELVLLLNDMGICCSTGSACNAGNKEPSRVLKAIHVPDEFINGTIRFSFNYENNVKDIDYVIDALKECFKIMEDK